MAMSASGSDGFAGPVPAPPPAGAQSAGRRFKECITAGCQRVFAEPNHRHCCSQCSEGNHTSRCNRRQRRRQRARITICWQVGCRRRADVSHTFCCSDCRHYQGRCHTQGCTERQHDLFAEAAMMSGPTAEDATVQPMEIVAVPTSAPFQTFYLAEPVVDGCRDGNWWGSRRREHGSRGSRGSRGNIFSSFDGLRANNCLWR